LTKRNHNSRFKTCPFFDSRNKNKKSWIPEEVKIAKKLGAHGVMIFEHHGIGDSLLKEISKI